MMEELPAFTFGISGVGIVCFKIPLYASARCLGRCLSFGAERPTKCLYKVSENADHDSPNMGFEQRVENINGFRRKSDQRQNCVAKT